MPVNRTWCSLLLAFIGPLAAGCGPAYYIGRIEQGHRTGWEVEKLGEFPSDRGARHCLLQVLTDDNPTVRCVAASALRENRWLTRDEIRRMLFTLCDLLDDTRTGVLWRSPFPWFLSWVPADDVRSYGSVRSQALLSLTARLGKDFGFDQAAWRAAITRVYGTEDDSPGP
jgi:hypothetical protein